MKDIIIAVALGATAAVAYEVSPTLHLSLPSFDSTVYPYPREQAEALLADARTTLPRRDGDGHIEIWGAGRSARGVTLNMRYASGAPLLKCEAVVTAVDPAKSRVVAECGSGAKIDSAVERTKEALDAPMFEEHIQATLEKRTFHRENAERKEQMIVLGNMPGMQREAIQRSLEAARAQSQ